MTTGSSLNHQVSYLRRKLPAPAVALAAFTLTVPTSFAALVVLPEVVVTSIANGNNSGTPVTGVSSRNGYGSYTSGTTPGTVNVAAGDVITATFRASDGMIFRLDGGLPVLSISLIYGDLLGESRPLTSYTMDFNNLSGGSAPTFGLFGGATVGPFPIFGEGVVNGVNFVASLNGRTTPDTITFDRVTWTGTATNTGSLSFSTLPVQFEFYASQGGLSLVSIPEPSSSLLVGIAGILPLMRRRRGHHPQLKTLQDGN